MEKTDSGGGLTEVGGLSTAPPTNRLLIVNSLSERFLFSMKWENDIDS